MKVTMTDTVEAAHTIIPELEKAEIKAQPGLTVISRTDGSAGGMTAESYVLSLRKDAMLSLPDRLGKRLVKLGLAKVAWGK